MNTPDNIYILEKKYLKNICSQQRAKFFENFDQDKNGNICIPYSHKGYLCQNSIDSFANSDVQAISFFSGCGGLDIGAQLAGVKVISSLDFYADSVNTLKNNPFFGLTQHFCADINDVGSGDFSKIISKNKPSKLLVIGGPPCQPFSKAGYWVTNEKRQANNDPRNMIGPYFRLISEIQPDGFVLENVESILHPSNHEAIENINENMTKLGYNYSLLKINAAEYGIPQKRKRVFFLASRKKINAQLSPFTVANHSSIDKDLLSDLSTNQSVERVIDWIGKFDDAKYFLPDEDLTATGKWGNELTCIPPGKNYIALTEKAGYPEPKFVAGTRYWLSLLKLHPLEPSWTIIASPGHWEGPFHWNNRRLSVRECAALQTFPDDYIFYGSPRSQRKQIGNAVPPLLAKQIISELLRWI